VIMLNKFGDEIIYDSELESATGTLFMQSEASRYFSVLSEGDSATFLLPGSGLTLPGMPDTGMVEMNVKVVRILTPEEVADREASIDHDAGEILMIQRYLLRKNIRHEPDSLGLVWLERGPGTGDVPVKGDTVTLKIKGEMLNGRVFDDSDRYGGLTFTWGDEGQVIPGIRQVLWALREGGYVKIILPSRLAFGREGSSTGIVPPHTPVIYTIELLHIR
jgi:FKBP-type peptidyl-prolyl cis-trans isomerase FkpA